MKTHILNNNQNLYFLIFLFAFSFFIRILTFECFFQNNSTMIDFDSKVYSEVGENISLGKGLTNKDGSSLFLRVPIYPLFLGLCYKTFGYSPKKALMLQSLISSLIPIIIFFISVLIFPTSYQVAYISSLISSIHVGFVTFSNLLMAESLFTLFFNLFLLFLFLSFKSKDNKLILFTSGILLGISSLIRPVGVPLLLTALLVISLSNHNIKKSIKECFILLSGWLLIIAVWLIRNFLLTSHIFFHTLPGIHFLKHLTARVVMEGENISYIQSLKKLDIELEEKISKKELINKQNCEIEKCIQAEEISRKYCLKYPMLTVKNLLINMFKTTFSLYSAELIFIDNKGKLPEYSSNRSIMNIFKRFIFPDVSSLWIWLIIYLEILFMIFLWIGNVGFIIKAIFKKNLLELIIKIFPFIFTFIFVSLACGFARLRLPIESFMIILSVYFWISYLET